MRSQNYSMPMYGGGQMVINMKTTVTTSGGQHNGLVVHSAVQSAGGGGQPAGSVSPSTSSNWQPYIESPRMNRLEDRIEMLRSNSSLHRDMNISSPLPIQMVPSTSRETLLSNTSKRAPSHVAFLEQRQPKPPSPPPSPIYSFKGRDSPPDEFIQPTKLMLNIFRPTHREPQWHVPISRSQVNDDNGGISLSKKNALLNDAVTTTTTVEVFRAPMDPNTPVIGLSQSPYGGQPLLVRAHGPQYEQWSNSKTQTMLADEPIGSKGVQWKERLVEGARYNDANDDKNSDYDEIMPLPYPDGKPVRQYINHDYRPNAARQPFQPITHPILGGSRDDLRSNHSMISPQMNNSRATSPMYVVPYRRQHREEVERRASRRSKSNSRDEPQDTFTRPRSLIRHRSMSPSSNKRFGGSQEFVIPAHSPIGSTLMLASPDPNELPGRPASARSQEIFALYQTRDALNRIVDHI